MSPRTAKVKCPHYGGQINFESEAVEAMACVEDGVRGADALRETTEGRVWRGMGRRDLSMATGGAGRPFASLSYGGRRGKVDLFKKLFNDPHLILEVLRPHKEDIVGIVVESTYNSYWMVDILMEKGYCLFSTWDHPARRFRALYAYRIEPLPGSFAQ
jgi:hypothetical protein